MSAGALRSAALMRTLVCVTRSSCPSARFLDARTSPMTLQAQCLYCQVGCEGLRALS